MKNLLLLSNSTLPGQSYFEWPKPYVADFTKRLNIKSIAFVPFAAVTFSFDKYLEIFQMAVKDLGIEVQSVHNHPEAINNADAIAVGGGNTFALLKRCYENNLISAIKERVENGIPYIGWSAGSNLACPFLCTTNDMPIVQPPSFQALNLIPFQINPHYTSKTIEGHGGESRDARLIEYIALNPQMFVAAIPEGSLLEIQGETIYYKGSGQLKLFKNGQEPQFYNPSDNLSFLLA